MLAILSWLQCVKVIFFLFQLIGVIVLAIAIWIAQLKKDYESINDLLTSPTILAIVAGAFMIIMAFAGLIGALRENLILLKLVGKYSISP